MSQSRGVPLDARHAERWSHAYELSSAGAWTISMMVWEGTADQDFDVAVRRDLSQLGAQLTGCSPGRRLRRRARQGRRPSGVVSSKYIVIAPRRWRGLRRQGRNVVNLFASRRRTCQSVLLRVRFADEPQCDAGTGWSYFTGRRQRRLIARGTTQQYGAPDSNKDKGCFQRLSEPFCSTPRTLGAVIRALKGRGLFQSLAGRTYPQDGKEASFLRR